MYTQVTRDDFHRAFRATRPDNFSYDGLDCLFDMVSSWEEESGEQVELDVIALCVEFTEYSSWGEIVGDYGASEDEMKDGSYYAEFNGGIIFRNM
jgi:hypothetical protein